MTPRLRDALSDARGRLSRMGVRNAEQEARWIVCHALGVDSAALFASPERPLGDDEARAIEGMVRRREAREPLQYILGDAPFFGRSFSVGPGVLIPRPDGEALIEAALSLFPRDAPMTFLDWGTGSGCLGATLLLELPRSTGTMVDVSSEALAWARRNVARHGIEGRARLVLEGLPSALPFRGELDLLISDPPYIPTDQIPGLMREVRDHEPSVALDGGPDGMRCYRMLLACAPLWLRPGGWAIFATGEEAQTEALIAMAPEALAHVSTTLPASADGSDGARCVTFRMGASG